MTHHATHYLNRFFASAARVAELLRDCAANPRETRRLVADFWKWADFDDKAAVVLLCAGCGATGAGVARYGSVSTVSAPAMAADAPKASNGHYRTIRVRRLDGRVFLMRRWCVNGRPVKIGPEGMK